MGELVETGSVHRTAVASTTFSVGIKFALDVKRLTALIITTILPPIHMRSVSAVAGWSIIRRISLCVCPVQL